MELMEQFMEKIHIVKQILPYRGERFKKCFDDI